MLIFIATTLMFALFGSFLWFFIEFSNVGIIYYIILSALTMLILLMIPYMKQHISKLLFMYTIIIIGCYTVYTS